MSAQEFPQLPKDQQWEYGLLITNQTAGFFGTIGAKERIQWGSTVEDEGTSSFEQPTYDLLYRAGRAGWELVSVATDSQLRAGTTHQSNLVLVFKQRRAADEDQAIAQLISPTGLLRRANKCIQQGNAVMARKVFNKALSLEPSQEEWYYLERGKAYLGFGDEQRALEDMDRVSTMNKQNGEASMIRGDIRLRQKEYDRAINNYNDALRLIHDDTQSIAHAKYNRGMAYSQMGKIKDAIRDFKECLSLPQLDTDIRNKVQSKIDELERRK